MHMDDKEIEKYVDDIFNLLNGQISKEEIKKLFNIWLSFHYPPELIKQKIVQKYAPDKAIKISDIKGEFKNLNLKAKIVSIKINDKDGRKIASGLLGDETGTIPFTTSLNVSLEKGDVIKITNAYTSTFNDVLRLYIPSNGKIEKIEDKTIDTVRFSFSPLTINKLQKNFKNLDVRGKILYLEEKNGKSKKRYTGIIADETGYIPFTSWGKKLEQGKSYRIRGAYVREYKNRISLNIDENMEILPLEDIDINDKPIDMIEALNQNLQFAYFEGIILDIKDDTGIIARCPVCGKALKGRECPEHGEVSPVNDLIGKVTFDDGTLAATMILNRQQMENITNNSFDNLMKTVISSPGIPIIKEELEKNVLLKPFKIFARLSIKDSNRIVLYPYMLKLLDQKYIEKLRESIQEMVQ